MKQFRWLLAPERASSGSRLRAVASIPMCGLSACLTPRRCPGVAPRLKNTAGGFTGLRAHISTRESSRNAEGWRCQVPSRSFIHKDGQTCVSEEGWEGMILGISEFSHTKQW